MLLLPVVGYRELENKSYQSLKIHVTLNFSADTKSAEKGNIYPLQFISVRFGSLFHSVSGHRFFLSCSVCHLQLRGKPTVRKSQDGNVFKRITGRLCQTTQDKEITFANPTLWCSPHKMSLSSAIIEHWADHDCAGVIPIALSLLTFKVSCLSVLSRIWKILRQCSDSVCWVIPLKCCSLQFTVHIQIRHFY